MRKKATSGRMVKLDNLRSELSEALSARLSRRNVPRRCTDAELNAMIAMAYMGGDIDDWEAYQRYMDNCWDVDGYVSGDGFWDGDDDYGNDGPSEDDFLYPLGVVVPSRKKGGKKGGKKKIEKEENFRTIWYYPDYHAEDDRLEFNGMAEFQEFCNGECMKIPLDMYKAYEDAKKHKSKYGFHCTLDPVFRQVGRKNIVYGLTYGEMFYEACDSDEL